MAAPETEYAWLLNNPLFADAKLVITTREGCMESTKDLNATSGARSGERPDEDESRVTAEPSCSISPPEPRSIYMGEVLSEVYAHRCILASASQYFRTHLSNWQAPGTTQTLPVVCLKVQPDEAPLAQLLADFIYTRTLPDLTPEELLTLLTLSDTFEVKSCMALCISRLERLLVSDVVNLGLMTSILSLPDCITRQDACQQLVRSSNLVLLRELGDLEAAWASDVKKKAILQLPLSAIEFLLGSSESAVASENTIFVVLEAWLQTEQGQAASMEEQKRLCQLVRLPHLEHFYLAHVAFCSPWFTSCLDMSQVQEALCYLACPTDLRKQLYHDRTPESLAGQVEQRKLSSLTSLCFEWSLQLDRLLEKLQAYCHDVGTTHSSHHLESPTYYFNGFQWYMKVEPEREPDEPADGKFALWVGIYCKPSIDKHRLHIPPDQGITYLKFRGKISAWTARFDSYSHEKEFMTDRIQPFTGIGFVNFFHITNHLDRRCWQNFVNPSGELQLKCEITECS